jgi:hypothetical protein
MVMPSDALIPSAVPLAARTVELLRSDETVFQVGGSGCVRILLACEYRAKVWALPSEGEGVVRCPFRF